MPYIPLERRATLWDNLEYDAPQNPGELNYMVSQLCRNYIDTKKLSYQTINDIVGALEGAKLEMYRKVVAGYENQKEFENGKVYE